MLVRTSLFAAGVLAALALSPAAGYAQVLRCRLHGAPPGDACFSCSPTACPSSGMCAADRPCVTLPPTDALGCLDGQDICCTTDADCPVPLSVCVMNACQRPPLDAGAPDAGPPDASAFPRIECVPPAMDRCWSCIGVPDSAEACTAPDVCLPGERCVRFGMMQRCIRRVPVCCPAGSSCESPPSCYRNMPCDLSMCSISCTFDGGDAATDATADTPTLDAVMDAPTDTTSDRPADALSDITAPLDAARDAATDAPPPRDAMTDAPAPRDAVTDAPPPRDAATDAGTADTGAIPPTAEIRGAGGCSVGTEGGRGGLWLALVGLSAAWKRRRRTQPRAH